MIQDASSSKRIGGITTSDLPWGDILLTACLAVSVFHILKGKGKEKIIWFIKYKMAYQPEDQILCEMDFIWKINPIEKTAYINYCIVVHKWMLFADNYPMYSLEESYSPLSSREEASYLLFSLTDYSNMTWGSAPKQAVDICISRGDWIFLQNYQTTIDKLQIPSRWIYKVDYPLSWFYRIIKTIIWVPTRYYEFKVPPHCLSLID